MRKTLIRRTAWVFILALVSMNVLGGCYLLPQEEPALSAPVVSVEEIEMKTVEVTRGDIEVTVQKSGQVASATQADLYFTHSGTLDAMLVSSGQTVEKGDIVAQMEVDELEYNMQVAEINLKKARLAYSNNKSTDQWYNVELAQLAYERAEELYNDAVLTAPIDGLVTYVATLRAGDSVGAYSKVVRISDPDQLQVEITGTDAEVFTTGMSVEVIVDGKNYTGKVIQSAGEKPEGVSGEEEAKTIIEVDLKGEVKLGTSVTLRAVTESSQDTLLLPSSCITTYLGRTYVQVMRDGVKTDVDVEIGLSNATMTEILAGLNEGDEVIQ